MRVLVTGSGGHLGSFLVGCLLERRMEVIGVDHLMYGGDGMLSFLFHPLFRFEKLDLRKDLPGDGTGVDTVIHLAALVGPVCDKNPQLAWDTNCEATARLCRWAQRNRAQFLFTSTCSNYGTLQGVAREDSPLQPLGTYAETKVAAERIVADLLPDGVTLRLGTLAGLSPRPRFDTLLNRLVYEAYREGRLACHQPQARRPFLHLADAAESFLLFLDHGNRTRHRCYNVVGFNTAVGELIQAIQAQTACRLEAGRTGEDSRDYSVSSDRLADEMGFRPKRGLATCVQEVLSALRWNVVSPRKEHYNNA